MAEHREEEPEDAPGDDFAEPLLPGFVTGMALDRARRGRRTAEAEADARALLREQTRVLHLQAEHLHEQREVQLSHLKARRVSEWMKVGLQLLTAGVGLLVFALVAALVVDAFRSRAVVVDAFDAPPALAARGITGRVAASEVLDGLTRLQSATRATAAKRRLASAWSGDVKIEVPETGVSIGELRRLLHEMLGRDLHIGGDLVQGADGGLQLTVRGDEVQPKTFTGGPEALDALSAQAAEYIYGQADPYLLAAYLSTAGRADDALSFIAGAYPEARETDRPELLNQWGNALFALDRAPEAVEKYRAAIDLQPDFWKAWGNLIRVSASAEGEEAAYKAGLKMLALAKTKPMSDRPEPIRRTTFDALLQDWPAVYADTVSDISRHGLFGSYSTPASAGVAAVAVEQHNWDAARRNLDESSPDDPSVGMIRGLMLARQALERGDLATAVAALEPLYAKFQSDPRTRAYYAPVPCYLGLAYGLSGHADDSDRLLAVGRRWTSCASFKGIVFQQRGEANAADQAYKASIALAPDLPFPYEQYGLALLRRGDASSAARAFSQAHDRGPHWADPLKGWGDALAAQARWAEAASKYQAALVYAPHWMAAAKALADAKRRLGR